MPLPPNLKTVLTRAALGAGLGAATSMTTGVGAKFLHQFLQPLSKNERATEFVAKAMYERERIPESAKWDELPSFDKDIWRKRGATAFEAMVALFSRWAMPPGK